MKYLIFALLAFITVYSIPNTTYYSKAPQEAETVEFEAYITGYNTVREQTDNTPCYARDVYICGRTDVVACPRDLPFGTKVTIHGKEYECVDRTALKYNNRFDISCDKDFECPYKVTGWTTVAINILSTE